MRELLIRLPLPHAVEQYVMDTIWCAEGELYSRADWLPKERTWALEASQLEESIYGCKYRVIDMGGCRLLARKVADNTLMKSPCMFWG